MAASDSERFCSQALQEPTERWERRDFRVTFEALLRPSKFINKGSPGSLSRSPAVAIVSVTLLVALGQGSLCSPPPSPFSTPSVTHLPICIRFGSASQVSKCQVLTASIRDCHEGLPESPARLCPARYHQTNYSATTTSPR